MPSVGNSNPLVGSCARGFVRNINIPGKPRALVNHFYVRPLLSFPRRINKVRLWMCRDLGPCPSSCPRCGDSLRNSNEKSRRWWAGWRRKPESLCHAPSFCKKFQFSWFDLLFECFGWALTGNLGAIQAFSKQQKSISSVGIFEAARQPPEPTEIN